MIELVLLYLLICGAKKAWDDTRAAWGKSRKAYMKRAKKLYPSMSRQQRAAHAARHDLGYGLSQLLHGFPQARHGFAQGWNEGRQAHVQARTAREQARTAHAETRAGALAQWRELQERRREAQEEIRRQRQGEAPEGSPEGSSPGGRDEHEDADPAAAYCGYCGTRGGEQCPPRCATWTRDNPYPGREGGPAYSWGYEGATSGWPAATAEQAHDQARHMSTGGDPQVVTEYPTGGGPGETVAVYRDGEIVPPAPPAGNTLAGVASVTPLRCRRHPGRNCAWIEYGDGTGGHVIAPEQEVPGEGSSAEEGSTSMSDVTYGDVVARVQAAAGAAEQRSAETWTALNAAEEKQQEAETAKAWAHQTADQMQALNVDAATLGAMADHLDAADSLTQAHQHAREALEAVRAAEVRVMETAQNVSATLQRGHQGLAEAHQNAPVEAANREFYQD